MRTRTLIVMLALICILQSGCRNPSRRKPPASCPPAYAIPPAGIPEGGAPPMAPVPGRVPPAKGNDSEWLEPQDPPPPGKSRSEYSDGSPPAKSGAILGEPEAAEKPPGEVEAEKPARDSEEPREAKPTEDQTRGIADYSQVKQGVSSGRRPEIEGLDWLKEKGYRTVVSIHRAGDDDATDRRQIEKREMKYVSLVVAPGTLTQEWMEEFNRIVGETGSRPIFVYGEPELTGAIWYLHLRMAEFLTHDEARVRAGRLGSIDEQSEIFQAALKVLPRN